MPAPEIVALVQAVTDGQSAFDTLQDEFAVSLSVKNTAITDLQTSNSAKDVEIAALKAQVANSITAAEVSAVTTSVQALTADIAGTPTS